LSQRQDAIRRLLEEVDGDPTLSQRALAVRLGVSVGSVNQLLRRLVRERWLRRVPFEGRRIRYVVSAEGAAARDRMWREHLDSALALYGAVRDRVRSRLEACATHAGRRDGRFQPAVVLYGVGDVAQIAFACAADLGVPLVGFVDESPRDSFLGLPVRAPGEVKAMALDGQSFDWLFVATLVNQDAIRERLAAIGFPLERVSWL
jgi:DNA-binding MarR family transcriptional regulator